MLRPVLVSEPGRDRVAQRAQAAAVDWDLIAQQYDQIVKYTTALRLGTAGAEQVLRQFTRGGPKHPTYQADRGAGPGGPYGVHL
ncbi:transposase [Streptomyces alanosinicus]|uniref:Tn3 transposase DDE domain-containing protein n=1 Tax=Streptomyces alanosinicus TaxID=68171 RepID=A0A919D6R9_9ACTN|nr:transposase [Streptomyces alanosinicus]GHE15033.1 hypothetical protein GCM10010339_88310 [Streptomyces alanosinicus]